MNWKKITPIFTKKLRRYDGEIRKEYNLNDSDEMDKCSKDLVQELVLTCERYKQFTVGFIK